MALKKVWIILTLCAITFGMGRNGYSEEKLLKLAVPGDNLFYQSLLPELMKRANYTYTTEIIPFHRAVWGLIKGDFHVIGPYTRAALTQYGLNNKIELLDIIAINVALDRAPMFGLYVDEKMRDQGARNLASRRLVIKRGSAVHMDMPERQLFQAKSLDQLVKLLTSERAEVAIVSKKDMDQVRRDFPHVPLLGSYHPLFFQNLYLFVTQDEPDLKSHLESTLASFVKSDFYNTRWERYSEEKEWQN